MKKELSQSAFFMENNGNWFFILEADDMPLPVFGFELDADTRWIIKGTNYKDYR